MTSVLGPNRFNPDTTVAPRSFQQILQSVAAQEGVRYQAVLQAQGWLPKGTNPSNEEIQAATTAWRVGRFCGPNQRLYLPLTDSSTTPPFRTGTLTSTWRQLGRIYLGGYPGWLDYRPRRSSTTCLHDVAVRLFENKPIEAHRTDPKFESLRGILFPNADGVITPDTFGTVALVQNPETHELVIVDGTHRLVALLLELTENGDRTQKVVLPNVALASVPADAPAWRQLCDFIPVIHGPH